MSSTTPSTPSLPYQQQHQQLKPIYHNTTILPPQDIKTTEIPTPKSSTTTYPNTKPTSNFFTKMHHSHNTVQTTRTTKPTLMTRLRGRHANKRTVKTTTVTEPRTTHAHHTQPARTSRWGGGRRANRTTVAPVHHHKRHVSIGDKISGAMLKLKGSLTHRPGVKAAGTRRMNGTDGRGSHRTY